jgi:S-adenosylmethionine synthetase
MISLGGLRVYAVAATEDLMPAAVKTAREIATAEGCVRMSP